MSIKKGDKAYVRQFVTVIQVGKKQTHTYEWSKEPVRVMAIAEGYAMVRFKGAMPFVEPLTYLTLSKGEES